MGRLMEFYPLPSVRAAALPMFHELIAVSGATSIEAQTNIPLLLMLLDCAENIRAEAILFEDARTTHMECFAGVLRRVGPENADRIFAHEHEPVGEWMIEVEGEVVATGGALHHYNPPYADLFMEVAETHRQRGYGSYLVQELKRICYENGNRPAARSGAENIASRATLQKAGFLPCGRLLVGEVLSSARHSSRRLWHTEAVGARHPWKGALSQRTLIPLRPPVQAAAVRPASERAGRSSLRNARSVSAPTCST